MRADDPLGAAEALERLEPEHARARTALLVPEAGQHELEVRRLDRARAGRPLRLPSSNAFAGAPERDAADLDLVEDLLDERGLGRDRVVRVERGVPLERLDDRLARRVAAEAVEPQIRLEQARECGP